MPKVMLVEDDSNMLSMLQMLLQFEGYQVVAPEAGVGAEAVIKLIQHEKPALLFLDVHLGRFSGFDLLCILRQDPHLVGMRILMASGMDLSYKCRQQGADGFIMKPFMPDELIGEIQKILQ
ncbi:MAG TPA: response regulator [Anaerolineales bacterium]|nr:response regulator [Anaerolineales bacterium]